MRMVVYGCVLGFCGLVMVLLCVQNVVVHGV